MWKKKMTAVVLSLALIVSCFSFSSDWTVSAEGEQTEGVAGITEENRYSGIKNVIFMIGDGMGPNQVSVAAQTNDAELAMERMAVKGTVCTNNVQGLLTDSAAAGTALSTGVKTTNGTVAKDADDHQIQTMLEYFAERNKKTGLVTTSYLLDATPATFGAHASNRTSYTYIAKGYFKNQISVLLGGGLDGFLAETRDFETGKSITLLDYAKKIGYQYVSDLTELQNAEGEMVLGLFAHHCMNYEEERSPKEPSIADMTKQAISLLSENEDGFFLMVEAGNIDHAGHANNLSYSVGDTIAFSEAVEVALEFLNDNPDTLLIVTADHETGGLICVDDNYAYSTTDHSNVEVPYYVAGKGAKYFRDLTDNTEISLKVRQAATELDPEWIAENRDYGKAILIGTIGLLGIVALGGCFFWKRKRRRKESQAIVKDKVARQTGVQ